MNKFVKDLMSEGKSVNEVLEMPIHYVNEILREKVEVRQANSFFDLMH